MSRITLATLGGLLLATAPAAAQLGSYNPRAGARETLVIRNAMIHPVTGPVIARGSLVVSDGRITAIGATVTEPTGARVIDANGLHVWPGMMDGATRMGLSEIPQGANATVDASEVGDYTANAQAINGLNPHSAHIGVTRMAGITHVVSAPTGGTISGSAALVHLGGDTPPEMSVVRNAAMVITLPRRGFGGRGGFGGFGGQAPGSTQDADRARERQLDSLRAVLADARAYAAAHAAAKADPSLPRPAEDLVLAALGPAVAGTMPVLFNADRAGDIREAITFAEAEKLKPIIIGGTDAWQVASLLKEKDVPVVLTGIMGLPSREDDPYDVNFSAPSVLAKAGVRFAISAGDDGAEVRNLPQVAGMAAAFGLAKEDALKAVTLWPAQIFGVADRLGSLEVGKMANVVVTDGDILEARTRPVHLIIDGRVVPLGSKHEALYEMFKDRP